MSTADWIRRTCLTGLILCLSASWAHSAPNRLHAVGDQQWLWLLIDDPQAGQFQLLGRRQQDPPNVLYPIDRYTGKIRPGAPGSSVTAGGDALWLVYADDSVQMLSPSVSTKNNRPNLTGNMAPALPPGASLRSLAANKLGVWALVRVENARTLQAIDQSKSAAPPDQALDDESDATAAAPSIAVDRLLRLDRGAWVKFDLPQSWPNEAQAWAIVLRPNDPAPALLVSASDQNRAPLRQYHFEVDRAAIKQPTEQSDQPKDPPRAEVADASALLKSGRWTSQVFESPGAIELGPIALDGQLIVAQRQSRADRVEVALWALHQGQALKLGVLSAPANPVDADLALTSIGKDVALIVHQNDGATQWTKMNLMGQVTLEATPMQPNEINPYVENAGTAVTMTALGLSVLLMFAFWKREAHDKPDASPTARSTVPTLPKQWVVCDLSRRFIGGVIDLAPAVAITCVIFGLHPTELLNYYPLNDKPLDQLPPILCLIGLYVLITAPCELFTARSLGKWITGSHIATLTGQPPTLWRVVARNLLKILDLLVAPLLILILFSPRRQRLGDLVAQTVVIRPADENDSAS